MYVVSHVRDFVKMLHNFNNKFEHNLHTFINFICLYFNWQKHNVSCVVYILQFRNDLQYF